MAARRRGALATSNSDVDIRRVQKSQTIFRLAFAIGKIKGTLRMRSHICTSCHLQVILQVICFRKHCFPRKDFQEIFRLAWVQEVSGSDPDAPTNLFCDGPLSIRCGRRDHGAEARGLFLPHKLKLSQLITNITNLWVYRIAAQLNPAIPAAF